MHLRYARLAAIAAALGVSSLAQATFPTSIPSSFIGTYSLTYAESNPTPSPIEDGMSVTMVIQSTSTVCFPELGLSLSNPFLTVDGGAEANWSTGSGLLIGLSNINTGVFNEVNLGQFDSATNQVTSFYGQFNGSKTSDATSCDLAPQVTADMQTIVDLAKELYPSLFGNADPFKVWQGYTYTYFPATKIFAGFKDGNVYLLGGPFGNTVNDIVNKGVVTQVKTKLEELKIELTDDGIDVGENPDLAGDYDLTLTGDVTTFGISTAIPAILIENIKAPDPDDVDDVEQMIKDTLEDIGTVNSLVVEKITFTDARVTFRVEFSTTIVQSGVSVTAGYDITYDYVKN